MICGTNIPDKSLVGGKVPKCITSQLAQLKILLLLYILFQLIKTLPNIKCMWTPLDGMRDWSIFSNSFFKYNSDNLPGLNSVPASSTHYWTWFIHGIFFFLLLILLSWILDFVLSRTLLMFRDMVHLYLCTSLYSIKGFQSQVTSTHGLKSILRSCYVFSSFVYWFLTGAPVFFFHIPISVVL